jgi:sigma-B regulation protein RsbU (phosphoserine phosphatase)
MARSPQRSVEQARTQRGQRPPAAPTAPSWRRRQPLRELARAAAVQQSLLPDVRVPVGEFRLAALYWPLDELGGDFYDLARRPDCGVLLAADVMGHGVEAALITMLVKAAFQEAAATTGDPGELLAEMRAHLSRTVPPNRTFVATLVVRLDLHGPCLQIANAGQPHPFVLRAGEQRLDEIGLDGAPLGLADGFGLGVDPAIRVSLGQDDVLFIASDGLGSVTDSSGEFFGQCRFRQALTGLAGSSGHDVINHLAAEAVVFGHGQCPPDDVNLIAIWRSPQAADQLGAPRALTGPAAS